MSKKRKTRKTTQKRKNTTDEFFTKKDAKAVFDRQKDVSNSIVNKLYTQILVTAHPGTKNIVENHLIDAIQAGFNIKNSLDDVDANPNSRQDLMTMMQQAAKDIGKSKIVTDIIKNYKNIFYPESIFQYDDYIINDMHLTGSGNEKLENLPNVPSFLLLKVAPCDSQTSSISITFFLFKYFNKFADNPLNPCI